MAAQKDYNNQLPINEKNMLDFLQQKVYYQRALIFLAGGEFKEAGNYFYKCLVFQKKKKRILKNALKLFSSFDQDHGEVYNIPLKIKCLRQLEELFSKLQGYDEEAEYMKNLAQFYSQSRRDFFFLIGE